MFQGFTDRTFEFFMAISFNNNREFFHDNHDWYMEAIRQPLIELAADLSGTIEKIDDRLERRPERCVSRINRDIRFSRDKSPYRDYMWIAFHNPEEKHSRPGYWMDISLDHIGFGMGFYEEDKSIMDAHRQFLMNHPEEFKRIIASLNPADTLSMDIRKRMKVPEGIDENLQKWYSIKSVGLSRELSTESPIVRSSALAEEIAKTYLGMKPLYDYFANLKPVLV